MTAPRPQGRTVLTLILVTLAALWFPALVSAQPGTASPAHSGEPKFLKLDVDAVSPTSVTFTDQTLTVSATITNIGDRAVNKIAVRPQRALAIASDAAVRTTLQLPESQFTITGQWQTLPGTLQPGQTQRLTVTAPLHGDGAGALRISQPGVYPLLLNVNGTPEYGSEARLDDARFLLPVLGVTTPKPAAAKPPRPPAATTFLWPLAEQPQLAAGHDPTGKPTLTSDNLARSLGGGRLDGLLTALEEATAPGSDPARALAASVCIAVDPDLLVTVAAMRDGYQVAAPAGSRDGDRAGSGSQAAGKWLNRLSALAKNLCTVAVPFAQTDLAALASVNDPGLSASALTAPANIADTILGTPTVRGISWPDAGAVPDSALKVLRTNGIHTALVGANTVSGPGWLAPPGPTGPGLRTITFDESVHAALAAAGDTPQTPSITPAAARYPINEDSRTARLQDALGALTWSATNQPARTQLIAPPQLWSVNATEAAAVLAHAATLLKLGLTVPQRLTDLPPPAATAPAATVRYPPQAGTDSSSGLDNPARAEATRLARLTAALAETPQHPVTPASFTEPMRQDLLRTLTLAGRRDSEPTRRLQAQAAAQTRVDAVRTRLTGLLQSVSVVAPGGAYTLASEQSPLLIAARNGLPVAIKVRVKIDPPPGMNVTDIGPQELPPNGIVTLRVPASISDSRNLIVNLSLVTPGPEPDMLGSATSVSVRSNAYGRALTYLTAAAGGLLVFLSGRRLMRRFRGEPDPADEGVPARTRQRINRLAWSRFRGKSGSRPE